MYVENPDDYRLKYAGTIVQYDGRLLKMDDFGYVDGIDEIVASVSEVSPRQGYKRNDEEGLLKIDKALFNCKYPKLGWINTHRQAIYITRAPGNPDAKFKKAFHCKGIKCSYYRNAKGNMIVDKESTIVYSIFNPTFFDLDKALELVYAGKRHCVAINYTYAILADFTRMCVIVMRGPYAIGIIDKEGTVSLPGSTVFLMEELVSNGFKVSIC